MFAQRGSKAKYATQAAFTGYQAYVYGFLGVYIRVIGRMYTGFQAYANGLLGVCARVFRRIMQPHNPHNATKCQLFVENKGQCTPYYPWLTSFYLPLKGYLLPMLCSSYQLKQVMWQKMVGGFSKNNAYHAFIHQKRKQARLKSNLPAIRWMLIRQ